MFYCRGDNNSFVVIILVAFHLLKSISFVVLAKLKELTRLTKLIELGVARISSIRFYKAFYCYLEKLMFCQEMLDIMIDDNVDVDLLRKFQLVKKLLIKKFSFVIDFSMKGRTNLLTN